jgi:kumamolisin
MRDADPRAKVEITITLRGPSLPDPNNIRASAISAKEFTSQYGASRSDADKVSQVLKRFGLRIDEVSLPTRSMRVSGTVAAMEKAFQPNLGIYVSPEQGEFRDRQGQYKIPKELEGIVTAVLGFGQRQVARRRRLRSRRNFAAVATRASRGRTGGLSAFSPRDFEDHYSFPPGDGRGQRIAIADFGGGAYLPDDLKAYCARVGRAVPTVNLVSVNRKPLNLEEMLSLGGDELEEAILDSAEVMMDVQIVAGFCPNAQIDVYFAKFDQKGWVDLINRVIRDRPVALSVSWGLAEDDGEWSKAAVKAINERLQIAASLGITVCVAAGNDGSGNQISGRRAHVDFPSASPFVLGVGGTMMKRKSGKIDERAWRVSPGRRTDTGLTGATGGGVSAYFQRPAWQNVKIRSVNYRSIDGRVVPDVAALAGLPFYELIFLGGYLPYGGTSASAPLWAALIARINAKLPPAKRQRFLTPLLYQNGRRGKPIGQRGCRDITKGNNTSNPSPGKGYRAKNGFDAVSGWGTPIGTALLSALKSA